MVRLQSGDSKLALVQCGIAVLLLERVRKSCLAQSRRKRRHAFEPRISNGKVATRLAIRESQPCESCAGVARVAAATSATSLQPTSKHIDLFEAPPRTCSTWVDERSIQSCVVALCRGHLRTTLCVRFEFDAKARTLRTHICVVAINDYRTVVASLVLVLRRRRESSSVFSSSSVAGSDVARVRAVDVLNNVYVGITIRVRRGDYDVRVAILTSSRPRRLARTCTRYEQISVVVCSDLCSVRDVHSDTR